MSLDYEIQLRSTSPARTRAAGHRARAAAIPLEWTANPAGDHERRPGEIASNCRRNLRQRILDEQTAGGAQPARSVIPRLLQASTAALFYRSVHQSRRRGVRPVHGTWNDGGRGGAGRTDASRLRHQPPQRDTGAAARLAPYGGPRPG